MKTKALVVHSSRELKKIKEFDAKLLLDSDIYFLSADVDYNHMKELGISGYSFFDNDISLSELKDLHTKAVYLTDHWYYNKDGHDVSMIDHFSIGKCFHQFLCHTFCLALKYQRFLNKIKSNYSEILITQTPNSLLEIFLESDLELQKKIKRIERK